MGMQPTGDYGEFQHLYRSKRTFGNVLAADTGPVTAVSAKNTDHQVFVQYIRINITTYSAKTIAFADSTGTPVQVALFSIPAAQTTINPGLVSYVADFGPAGFGLTKGKNLVMTLSAAGLAFTYTIESYEKLVGPVSQE